MFRSGVGMLARFTTAAAAVNVVAMTSATASTATPDPTAAR